MKPNLDEVEPVDAESAAARPVPLELDQLDLVYALHALRNKLREVLVQATTVGARDCPWAELAAVLDSAATLCRQEAAQSNSEEEPCSVVDSRRPASKCEPVPPARAVDSTRTASSPTVRPVEASEKSSPSECPDCDGTGVMRWQQPMPDEQGRTILREMEHPCPAGCGGDWKHPHAERGRVVESDANDAPTRIDGEAKAAQQLHPLLGAELERIFEKFGRRS